MTPFEKVSFLILNQESCLDYSMQQAVETGIWSNAR